MTLPESGPPAPRPSTLAIWSAFLRRDFTVAKSYRIPFLLDIGSAGLQVALFFFLASVVDRADAEFLESFDGGYFAYVLTGLVVLRTVDTAVRSFAAGTRGEQVAGTFEPLLTAPRPLWVVTVGGAAYSLAYGIAVALLMLGFALVLGLELQATWASAASALLAYLACLATFSGLGMAVAAFVIVHKQGESVLGLVSQALALLAGVYFPVALLPPFLQRLADVVPLTWALDALRGGLLGGRVEWGALVPLLTTAALTPVLAALLLRLAVTRARREGTLAGY